MKAEISSSCACKPKKSLRHIVKMVRAHAKAQAKPEFSVPDAKRAAKLLQSLGKTVTGIELIPGGGFRVTAVDPAIDPSSGQGAANPWDEVLPK